MHDRSFRRPRSSRPHGRDDGIHVETVSRAGGGERRLARLEPHDDRRYAASVLRVMPHVEHTLGPQVIANRACRTRSGLVLEEWTSARTTFRQRVRSGLQASGAVFVGDVRACYGSMRPEVVMTSLAAAGVPGPDASAVAEILRSFEQRGLRGLPIGPTPSAVLANAVLSPVDRALREAGLGALRWVDDVVVFAPDLASAKKAGDRFRLALATLGLEANEDKTRVIGDRAEAEAHLITGRCSPAGSPGMA